MTTPDGRHGHARVDLLWVLAHPDDESFGSAGTMAWARDAGLRTAYICATRGEAGGIREPELATRDTLGAIREHELRAAMARLSLSDLRLLGFRDSGMENTPDNDHPLALINQPSEVLLAHLVGHLRDMRPDTVITFGPDGVYGHPDHVCIGSITTQAVVLAADPSWHPNLYEPWRTNALYFASVPRERMLAFANQPDNPLGELSNHALRNLGSPSATITHWLNVERWVETKRLVLAEHRTQVDPSQMLDDGGESAIARSLHLEQYTRQPVPWDTGMTSHDPLTRARSEFGSATPPAEAIP
jgi:LmbE family N-acetylglucosaminyl deacetylase